MGKGVGQRRKTEKVADRKKTVWVGVGPWSQKWCPFFKKEKNFFWSLEQGLWTQVLGACSPPPVVTIAMGLGRAHVILVAAGPSLALSLVPRASLAFPLAVELPCLCTPTFSQLRHWKPSI
jgi:hypothetical protein